MKNQHLGRTSEHNETPGPDQCSNGKSRFWVVIVVVFVTSLLTGFVVGKAAKLAYKSATSQSVSIQTVTDQI